MDRLTVVLMSSKEAPPPPKKKEQKHGLSKGQISGYLTIISRHVDRAKGMV